jgi:hypothetical protein
MAAFPGMPVNSKAGANPPGLSKKASALCMFMMSTTPTSVRASQDLFMRFKDIFRIGQNYLFGVHQERTAVNYFDTILVEAYGV